MRNYANVAARGRGILAGMLVVLGHLSSLYGQQAGPREQIGVVFGRPVYRDELESKSLHRLFLAPVLKKYREKHQAELEPTEEEIATAIKLFAEKHAERMKERGPMLRRRLEAVEEELAGADLSAEERRKLELEKNALETRLRPPGRFFALFVLKNWTFQRHLYDRYGGGRILWQQAGIEAFDAMHNWLKDREAKGDFKITDEKLRKDLFHYWATQDHGAFLTGDKQRIRDEFLSPEWAPNTDADRDAPLKDGNSNDDDSTQAR